MLQRKKIFQKELSIWKKGEIIASDFFFYAHANYPLLFDTWYNLLFDTFDTSGSKAEQQEAMLQLKLNDGKTTALYCFSLCAVWVVYERQFLAVPVNSRFCKF